MRDECAPTPCAPAQKARLDMDEQRLRALASAASVGPWSVQGNNCDEWYVYALHARYETLPGNPLPVKVAWVPWSPGTLRHEHDAAYIAAASPDAVLALLDALDAAERERDRLDAALRASCIDAREELREMGGGCSRAVAAEAERDALAALLRTIKPILVTVREGSVPLDAPLASLIAEIDALDGAKGK